MEVIDLAKEIGLEISAEDLQVAMEKMQEMTPNEEGALSDADLEAVAGGAMCMEVAWLGFVDFSGLHAAAKSASW